MESLVRCLQLLGGKSPGIVVALPRLSDSSNNLSYPMFKSVYVIVPLLQYHIWVIPTWIMYTLL